MLVKSTTTNTSPTLPPQLPRSLPKPPHTTTTTTISRARPPPVRLIASSNPRPVPALRCSGGGGGGAFNAAPPALGEGEDEVCPVECVAEFATEEEFQRILERAKERNALVVVDFYRTSCGSCKYIQQGFAKLCKRAGDRGDADVVFLKHNVIDEYDEQSEVAERLRIKVVPLFHFYKDGVLLEAFATRDKERIIAAIRKYTSTD
ncbi:Thioredoxin-like 4, chloroplastic [Ananas comosus]|uniref:Thioredoxin-like 4, chloroplastic n=1 Tax=Ananas comosus TaxID=4615 RepID=A0A199UMM4_ANACO|nr:Thioredoxin-like 4, chloroplastic [Ananas comosus]